MTKTKYKIIILLVIACMVGCQDQRKSIVATHNIVGNLLITTKESAVSMYHQGAISAETYRQVRTNWLRGQRVYLQASNALDTILASDDMDTTEYAELITQAGLIMSDIAGWLNE